MELRSDTQRRRPGRYAEDDGPTRAERPSFVHPDAVFNPDLAKHCAFPSLPFDHPGPAPSAVILAAEQAAQKRKAEKDAEKAAAKKAKHDEKHDALVAELSAIPHPAFNYGAKHGERGGPSSNQSLLMSGPMNDPVPTTFSAYMAGAHGRVPAQSQEQAPRDMFDHGNIFDTSSEEEESDGNNNPTQPKGKKPFRSTYSDGPFSLRDQPAAAPRPQRITTPIFGGQVSHENTHQNPIAKLVMTEIH